MRQKREDMIDIIKAIGIISIVMGHSGWTLPEFGFPMGPFVYLYHIMVFLFVAGLCFKKESADEPYCYIGRRLKGLAPLYVVYNVVFILAHNLLRSWHIIGSDTAIYGINQIVNASVSSLTLVSSESMLGAFWFIPMYFFSVSFFAVLFHLAEKRRHAVAFHIVNVVLTGLLGIYVNQNQMYFNYHIQTSILGIPVIYLGYFVKHDRDKIEKYITWWGTIIAALSLYGILALNIGSVELSVNAILHPLLFYPVTCIGLYFCYGLAKILHHSAPMSRLFSFIGKNSFHIMALHFLAFKLVDVAYGSWIHAESAVIETYPHAFQCWYVYYIAGVFLPLAVITLGKLVSKQLIKR